MYVREVVGMLGMDEWEIIKDEKIKKEWLKWGNISVWDDIIERCDRVAEKLNLEFEGFSEAKTFYWGFYYYERYYAYFKPAGKEDNDDDKLIAVVLEIVADSKISEVIEIRVATEKYIEEQLKILMLYQKLGIW
jgi:hypothetical protein